VAETPELRASAKWLRDQAVAPRILDLGLARRPHELDSTSITDVVGTVHYAAGPIGRVSHGLRVVVTAPARSGVPSHGAPPRGRQLSARIISFFQAQNPRN